MLKIIHVQGQNQDLNLGGPKHGPKKFQVTWFIKKKKKIMVDKTIAFYYHKYLSQEGNNMNQKNLKVTIYNSNIFKEEE